MHCAILLYVHIRQSLRQIKLGNHVTGLVNGNELLHFSKRIIYKSNYLVYSAEPMLYVALETNELSAIENGTFYLLLDIVTNLKSVTC